MVGSIAGDETILVICSDSTTAGAVRTNCSGFWNPDALDYGRFNFSGTGGLSFTQKQALRRYRRVTPDQGRIRPELLRRRAAGFAVIVSDVRPLLARTTVIGILPFIAVMAATSRSC